MRVLSQRKVTKILFFTTQQKNKLSEYNILDFQFCKNKLSLPINQIGPLLRMEGKPCISLVDNEILHNEKIESLLRENHSLEEESQMRRINGKQLRIALDDRRK